MSDNDETDQFLITRQEAMKRYGLIYKRLNYLITDGVIPLIPLSYRTHRIPKQLADKAFEALATQGQEWNDKDLDDCEVVYV